jgi:hypothetical protein
MVRDIKSSGQASGWPEVEFTFSPSRLLALCTPCAAFALVSAASVAFDDSKPWSMNWLAGWLGLIFFSLATAAILKQALTRGSIVTIGPLGVRDIRVSPDWIPWAAITGVFASSRALMLRVDPLFGSTMALTLLARWTKPMNAAMGYRGYFIVAIGLNGGARALRRAVMDGLAHSRRG